MLKIVNEIKMELELNKVHHLDNRIGIPQLPEKCANLIIADPPYFEVKGDFDFVWKSFDEYLEFMEGQAKLYKSILSNNGTLFIYGHSKRIAYVQTIFDKYFNLENNLVWNKGSFMGLEESETLRSFAPCTERILMYSSKYDMYGGEYEFEQFLKPNNPFKPVIKAARLEAGLSTIKVAALGTFHGKVNHGGSVANWESGDNIPTPEQWGKLINILPITESYSSLLSKLEAVKIEYEKLRRPFNNEFKLQEVLNFSNEQATTGTKYAHDTVKPETLTRALILTCSRPNDLVVVPFAGSGTECAMAAKEGRRFVGFETTEKHVVMSNKRASIEMSKPDLFRQAI